MVLSWASPALFFLHLFLSVTSIFRGADMFGFFKKDPMKKLRQQYDQKLEQAMLAQRSGNLRLFADLTAESEVLWQQVVALEQQQKNNE
jgi:hypothetical protein